MKLGFAFILPFFWLKTLAQEPRMACLRDSVSIGEEFLVSLAFDHLPEAEVLFPKGSEFFKPFELLTYYATPTRTKNGQSTDSLVYKICSFKTGPVLKLSLPVWVLYEDDSTRYESNSADIIIKQLVAAKHVHVGSLKSSVAILQAQSRVPLGLWPKVLFGCLVFLALVFMFFRKQIQGLIARVQYLAVHRRFRQSFKRITMSDLDIPQLETVNKLWRNHMEWLEQKPYSSLSLAEINALTQNENLTEAIRELESALYGGLKSQQLPFAFQTMFVFANAQFKIRYLQFKRNLKNSKNGKSGNNSWGWAAGQTGT